MHINQGRHRIHAYTTRKAQVIQPVVSLSRDSSSGPRIILKLHSL